MYKYKSLGNKSLSMFTSSNISWNQGLIKLQRVVWHSCMTWGWPSLRRGEHLIEWYDYWVLSIKIGSRGICWHYRPYAPSFRRKTKRRLRRGNGTTV